MSLQILDVKIEGEAPLLMHNGRLANPLNPITKAMGLITAIPTKKRTDANFQQLSDLEWEGGAYVDDEGHLYIPGENLDACIRDGAKKERCGKDVQAGVLCHDAKLIHPAGKPISKLRGLPEYIDQRGVKIGLARIYRTRLRVPLPWFAEFKVRWDDGIIADESTLLRYIESAGQRGILDYKPKFGRFHLA